MTFDNKEIFAKKLKYYMDKNGVTRHELCRHLNLKYSTVSEWLGGKKFPRIDKIEMLANYFKIKKSDLIEEKSTPVAPDDLEENVIIYHRDGKTVKKKISKETLAAITAMLDALPDDNDPNL